MNILASLLAQESITLGDLSQGIDINLSLGPFNSIFFFFCSDVVKSKALYAYRAHYMLSCLMIFYSYSI